MSVYIIFQISGGNFLLNGIFCSFHLCVFSFIGPIILNWLNKVATKMAFSTWKAQQGSQDTCKDSPWDVRVSKS